MRKIVAVVLSAAWLLASCGGSSTNDAFRKGGGVAPTGPVAPTVATVTVTTDAPTIPSDGSSPAQIRAFVRGVNNNFLKDVPVAFTATSGGVQVVDASTKADGSAEATLSVAGDPSSRTITVTATAGGVAQSVDVRVVGSRLSIQGPASLVSGETGNYTIALIDGADKGIANRAVTLTSAQSGNTLTPASVTTDANGRANFTFKVNGASNDTITATALGVTAQQVVTVSGAAFTFTAPAANTEVALGASQPVTVRWQQAGVPVVGQVIQFATTRGTLSAGSATTDGNGDATVTISSTNAGGAVVSATAGTASSQRSLEFVATSAADVEVQASTFTVGPNEQSVLTAVVRDSAGNLVKNKTVNFSLQDVSGGSLSTASAVTDSQGRAQSVYTAGSVTTAQDGVVVTVAVAGAAGVQDVVRLTVAHKELFLTLGTGNKIEKINNDTQYQVRYAIQVTDATGNGVANVTLNVSVLSQRYYKGRRVAGANSWTTNITATCNDEDINRDGVLNPGEDFNNSGRIEAGNIATVNPRTVTTDASGFAQVQVVYPMQYAYYVDVILDARTSVQGSEFVRQVRFDLPGAAEDFNNLQSAPPGVTSEFGVGASCTDTL
ncbi:MAG: Ig-like domain-containing protein [Pseudomonadales bacterium]|nr:Ig-like domain-containing protein [Pseudomonadales bacterium]